MPRILESNPVILNDMMTMAAPSDMQEGGMFPLIHFSGWWAKAENVHYQTFTSAPHAPEFLRIYNVKGFFSQSCGAARITAAQYRQAQQLGLTCRHDDALTAKIIGSLGHYRLRILKAQEELGIRTQLFHLKEAICQNAFRRLYLLQTIERGHGVAPNQLRKIIEDYEKKIADEVLQLGSFIAEKTFNKNLSKSDLVKITFARSQVSALQVDLAEISKLKKKCEDHLDAPSDEAKGTDRTRDCVAHFVKQRINNILAVARNTNEFMTLSGAPDGYSTGESAFFRGSLHKTLSEAFQRNRDFVWDQKRAVLPEHQGDYSEGSTHLIIHSTQLLGSGKQALTDFIFGMNLVVLNPSYDAYADHLSETKIYSNRSHLSWLYRFLSYFGIKRKGTADKKLAVDIYRKVLASALEANQNLLIATLEDIWNLLHTLCGWIIRTLEVSLFDILLALKEVIADFWWQSIKAAKPIEEETRGYEELLREQRELFRWYRLNIEQQVVATLTEKLKISHKEIAFSASETDYLNNIRGVMNSVRQPAPLAQPYYHLQPYSPDDALSKLMDGIEGFYRFFALYYEICPSIAVYSSAIYLLSAAAIVNPALVSQISEALNFINTWSVMTAQAMSKSVYSQVMAAGFSGFKETLLTLQFVSEGSDSTLAHLVDYLKKHLPQIILGGAALVGTGYGLSALGEIPFIGSEAGNVPGLDQSFIAAKAGVVGYEAFHSEFRKPSLAARTISSIIRVPILALRIALIPLNMLHRGLAEICLSWFRFMHRPPSIRQIFKPLRDLVKILFSILLRLLDIVLRLVNLAATGLKAIPKVLVDWSINNLATLANHFQMVIGAGMGMTMVHFLMPQLSLLPLLAIGFGSAFLVQALCALHGFNLKLPHISSRLLRLKHDLFDFFDHLNRPIKQSYESMRNQLRRWLTAEEEVFATYHLSKRSPANVSPAMDFVPLSSTVVSRAPSILSAANSQGPRPVCLPRA